MARVLVHEPDEYLLALVSADIDGDAAEVLFG